ncbi:rhythmically expressed gene 2 protein-like [Bradysia coprophila]|uniref:rhythmically expressed gene 2 protein-like n=1 Tax=Bradysia coprophila TaxID=38358 RepID=UPI00187D7497|nr:rhythmically expressed gene 2 protein-like [Bradysia coprophila]
MSKLVKNLQKFKLITFDLSDTLVKFKRPPGIVYAETATALGLPSVDPQKLAAQFSSNFKQMDRDYPNFGRNVMGWDTWWEKLIFNIFKSAGTELNPDELYHLTSELIDKFETDECYEVQDGAIELIEKIKDIDKIVGIVSNFDPRLRYLVENMKLPQFDFVVGSYEAGAAKPDPSIFDLALKMTNFNAFSEQSLHIGNTPTLDYVAAKEADWSGALITNGQTGWMLHKDKINENHVFESLQDFLRKLETDDIEWDETTK